MLAAIVPAEIQKKKKKWENGQERGKIENS